jgi:preprotein translocase subunit YajC
VNNAAQTGNAWGMVLYCVVVIGIIYLLIVRPSKRRMAEYQKMLDSLAVGNRVMAAGIYGTIKKIGDKTVDVEIAKGVVVEVNKNAIAGVEK